MGRKNLEFRQKKGIHVYTSLEEVRLRFNIYRRSLEKLVIG